MAHSTKLGTTTTTTIAPMHLETHWGRRIRCKRERHETVDAAFRAAAAVSPDWVSLVDGPRGYTFNALNRMVDSCAVGLARRGVGRGDRVVVYLGNCAEAVISVLALARLGAILVPAGSRLRRLELEYVMADSEPIALIYDAALASEVPARPLSPVVQLAVGDTPNAGAENFAELLRESGSPPQCAAHEDDVFAILYTSGTTGRPKGAMLTHLGAVHSSIHWRECLGLGAGEISMLCIPWSHVAGLCGVVLPILHAGGRLLMMVTFARRAFLELAERERITHALMVPAMYGLCLLEPDLEKFDLSAWRLGVYGSAPMPEPTIQRFASAFPHVTMCNAYGATETTSPATIMPPGQGLTHSDSIGRVVSCGNIRVVDEGGYEVPAGERGEFLISGPMIASGYWRNEAATAAAFVDGWWRSGDIGSVDSDGYVRIDDRKKDMINRGGYKVYPAEVENVLADREGVIEAAVIGQPDQILGERTVAFVYSTGGVTEESVRAFCTARMADYKVPDRVIVSAEALPRNANGKIQKDQLRARATLFQVGKSK